MNLKKRFRRKVFKHVFFGLGGAIVIIGALFKILHFEIGPLSGGLVLGTGLIIEAIIFTISGLDTTEVVEEHEDFKQKLYNASGSKDENLSEKLNNILRQAKVDVTLINKLSDSINNLENSTKSLSSLTNAMSSTERYNEELQKAANQLNSLNEFYRSQIERASLQAEFNDQIAENAENLKTQMDSLTNNLSSLNEAYSGILVAMNKK